MLNEKNGYLYNGALMIEYGFQVESILGMDNTWRFNTKDPLFDSQEKKNMIHISGRSINDSVDCYAHKQLLTFHSSYFKGLCKLLRFKESISNDKHFRLLDTILQIAQGVHLKNVNGNLTGIMNFGNEYYMHNVIHYCERQLIENDLKLGHMKSWVIYRDELKHYLVHLLKSVKCLKEMIDEDDIEKMKGETMKMFVGKFLYNKF